MLCCTPNLNLEGAPNSALAVARGLAAAGATVGVIVEQDGPLRAGWEAIGERVTVIPPAGGRFARARRGLHLIRQYAAARAFRPDLVYANTVHAFTAVWTARALGVPAIWCIRESVNPFSALLPAGRYIRRTFDLRPQVVFVAEATRRLWGPVLKSAPVAIIPNGLDPAPIDRFLAALDRRALKARLGLPASARTVVIVGTTCERKGQQVFVEAALKLLARRGDEVHFLVVGAREGPYLDRLRQTILLARASDRIHLIHESPDAYMYYAAADVVCCCSFEESHPRVVLEAMAFGRALVATNVWGIPEQVEDGRSAVLVPPGDPLSLAARVGELLDDQARAAALGDAARLRFESLFASETMAMRYRDLALRVLGGHPAEGA